MISRPNLKHSTEKIADILVSVLMPCFNHERYVAQALQSIANSTYAQLELVFIDDASTDSSFAVAREWLSTNQNRFVRIVFSRHEHNQGITSTLNELVASATGSYITILASDDLLIADGISKQVTCLKETGAEFVFADAKLIDETGVSVSESAITFFGRDPKCFLRTSCLVVDVLLNWEAPWNRSFFTADLIHKIGLFDESLRFEDRDFIVRVLAYGSFAFIPHPVYIYRIRQQNRLTPGLDAKQMQLDYLRSEYKNFRNSSGLVKAILAINVLAGKFRFNDSGACRASLIWPFFSALRRTLVSVHLAAMRCSLMLRARL